MLPSDPLNRPLFSRASTAGRRIWCPMSAFSIYLGSLSLEEGSAHHDAAQKPVCYRVDRPVARSPAVPARGLRSVIVGAAPRPTAPVLLGHNEDNGGRIVMPQYVVPRETHEPGEVIRFENGGTTPQAPVTWAFIWSQTPGGSFSDFFMNEWGVAVASDNCGPTKEDSYEALVANGGITEGGIGYHIRRIIAERATTAREGVEIAAKLVEEFGYIAPGRSYQICDADEGWLMHIVRGKHYVAQRVPDDRWSSSPTSTLSAKSTSMTRRTSSLLRTLSTTPSNVVGTTRQAASLSISRPPMALRLPARRWRGGTMLASGLARSSSPAAPRAPCLFRLPSRPPAR